MKNELINFPKRERPTDVETWSSADGKDEARLISSVGEKLTPPGKEWLASYAVHIYRSKFSTELTYELKIHSTDFRKVPEKYAQLAMNASAKHLAAKYGHKPPKKVGKERDDI